MKTKQIEKYFGMIGNIKFENEHGGRYAYMQFMAYSRELIKLLRPFRNTEREIEAIESINWLFNEYLGMKFTHRHQSIFDNKMMDMKVLFEQVTSTLNDSRRYIKSRQRTLEHAQAA